ncbi:hypothetical protein K6U51_12455 [Vibrio fluvialis]|uniref:hypothetical protein n=1 Tax=Vibrio fluvialis TaxID=676 RepID=UPI001EEC8BEB|nr:hypothetical protein [Vibrio fluvialis]MCG6387492.1 hypothetical protein [Vibrio fluvialis]MCG6418844.1 hypothetical protein [Vibrio fluvialis]
MQRYSEAGWQIAVENLTIYGGQPIDAVLKSQEGMAIKLDESLKDKIKNGN